MGSAEVTGRGKLQKVFLATTALEEFWDTGYPLVFLGEWCLLHDRRLVWEKLNGSLLDSPYDTPDAGENAYRTISLIYERILPILGQKLNSIHGENQTDRYWRILIGPWLQPYLSILYDHFLHISHALNRHPNLTTIGISKNSFVVATDTVSFVEFLKTDAYNLQIYSKILGFLGIDFPRKNAILRQENLHSARTTQPWGRNFASSMSRWIAKVTGESTRSIHLHAPYLNKRALLSLVFRNPGRISPRSSFLMRSGRFEYDEKKRAVLSSAAFGDSGFEKCLADMLHTDMPQSFIEGYREVQSYSRKSYPKHPNAIFSSNSWYFDEHFKQWAANSASSGSLLLGTQHGGCYGTLDNKLAEDHETAIVDYYYSWGWEGKRNHRTAQIIPMPATSFAGQNRIGANNEKQGILWAATAEPRYVLELPRLPKNLPEYFDRQVRFARTLPSRLLSELRFRPHYEDHGWCIVQRIKDSVPEIQVESWDVSFWTSLTKCRLYVCDHLSTTYAQALATDKPTVLFLYDRQTTKLSPEATPYFDLLREVGILFDTPEAAAMAIPDIYVDVEKWWSEPRRQSAVRYFCERFARTSADAIKLWNTEFHRMASLGASGSFCATDPRHRPDGSTRPIGRPALAKAGDRTLGNAKSGILKNLEARLRREAFLPTYLGMVVSPLYIVRRGLYKHVLRQAAKISGDVLDLGCGSRPYESLFTNARTYTGVDLQLAGHSHVTSKVDVFYDGKVLPFRNSQFDAVLCFEVFEHVFNIDEVLAEIRRVLRPDGIVLITIPYAWQEHEIPFDFARYTSYGLKHVLEKNKFKIVELEKTTTFFLAICQLWIAYLTQHVSPQGNVLARVFQILVIFPLNVLSLLFDSIFPKRYEFFCSNVILCKKPID